MEKQPFEWQEEDIQRLIDNETKESTNLEYKRCDALIVREGQSKSKITTELSKDISSFANAAGGTIVYGIIEENHLPKEIDEGFDPTKTKREWLEDIIDSSSSRKIEGLRINQVELKTKPGKVIYVVYIPQSLQGAIQADDHRYYQRRNFKSEPMEDYQVRDVMNRFRHPILIPEIDYKVLTREEASHRYELVLDLANKGVVTAKAFGMDMLFPAVYSPQISEPRRADTYEFHPERPFQQYRGYRFRNTPQFNDVLFPGERTNLFGGRTMGKLTYGVNENNVEESNSWKIHITTYADDMPPKQFEYDIYHEF